MVTAITQGKDFNYFRKFAVTGTGFPIEAQVVINIKNINSFSLINEGTAIIEYSFNGNTLHGDMTPGTPSAAIFWDNRKVSAIWFRCPTGSSIIRVEAWCNP